MPPKYKCQPSDYLNKEIENGIVILVNATGSLIDPSSGRVVNDDTDNVIQSGQLMRIHCPRASTSKKFKKTANRIFATVAAPSKRNIFLCSILDIKLIKIL